MNSDVGPLILRFSRVLSPIALERALKGASPLTKREKNWSARSRRQGLFIDLSTVEFAEFTTLAHLALLIEGAARHRISVRVAPPLDHLRQGEERFLSTCSSPRLTAELKHRVEMRKMAKAFMHHAGFIDASRVLHVPDASTLVTIDESFDRSMVADEEEERESRKAPQKGSSKLESSLAAAAKEYYLSRIFPLRWWEPMAPQDFEKSGNFASFVMRCENQGLSPADAQALAGTLLRELVENVFTHSPEHDVARERRPHALVGAVVFRPDRYRIKSENARACMATFFDWYHRIRSRLLCIVVGDSGRGVAEVLGPSFSAESEEEVPRIDGHELTQTERILFWSFNKWSTTDLHTKPIRRGTRGLWLVQRMVRAYGGSITMRSADGCVGWHYVDDEEPTPFIERGLRYVPGTVLEALVLTEDRHPRRRAGVMRSAVPEEVAFRVVTPHSESGILSESEVADLVAHLAKSVPPRHNCGVLVMDNRLGSTRGTETVLGDALQAYARLPNHGALAIVSTATSEQQLVTAASSVDEVVDHRDRDGAMSVATSGDPVVLIGPTGLAIPYGGSETVRALLASLLATERGADLRPLDRKSPPALQPRAADIERAIRDQPDWIRHAEDGAACLRITPAHVFDTVIRHIQSQLYADIDAAHVPGVREGLFLAPSLRYVSRWIDVSRLVDHGDRLGIACFALARLIERQAALKKDLELVCVDSPPSRMARALAVCLGLPSPRLNVPGGTEGYGQPDALPLAEGKKVVLFADLLLTGGSVERAITALRRASVEVVAVACFVDARVGDHSRIAGIPVARLVDTDIILPSPATAALPNATYIDPVLREPVKEELEAENHEYPIPPQKLLEWCEDESYDSLLLCGHIRRDIGRHFTTYLHAQKLIDPDSPHRDAVIGTYADVILDWVGEQNRVKKQPVNRVVIWYPGEGTDFAGVIARHVAHRIAESSASSLTVLGVYGVPRRPCMEQWVFPNRLDSPEQPAHVVMVDWGSITSATIKQFIRLATKSQAVSFLGCIFLSQMPSDDETALRRIAAIRTDPTPPMVGHAEDLFAVRTHSSAPPGGPARDLVIPARIAFISSLQLGHFPASECPLCKLREQYKAAEREAPTRLLRTYASRVAEGLSQTEREDVAERIQQQDLYGVPLTQSDLTRLVRLRQRLEQAVRSTHSRQSLMQELDELAPSSPPRERAAWIRLLATEPVWLKVPPLCFLELRDSVARLALGVALDDGPDRFAVAERQQAILVLRAASKVTFASQVREVLLKCAGEPQLVRQLLYDVYTLTISPERGRESVTDQLREELYRVQEFLNVTHVSVDHLAEYMSTVGILTRAAELHLLTRGKQQTLYDSWHVVHDKYFLAMRSHHAVKDAAFRIALALSRPQRFPPNAEQWHAVMRAWEECQDFLLDTVFPYFGPLLTAFLQDPYVGRLGPDAYSRLQHFKDSRAVYQMGHLADLLSQFERNPDLFLHSDQREVARREWEWWLSFFLRPEGGTATTATAYLLRMFLECPCDLVSAIETAVGDAHARWTDIEWSIEAPTAASASQYVFCDRRLLEHAIRHTLENAMAPKHRRQPSPSRGRVALEVIPDEVNGDRLNLHIRNTGTRPRAKPGDGFRSISKQLAVFSASLEGKPLDSDGWTYDTRLLLRRW